VIEAFRVELEEIEELVLTKANESLISKLMHVRSNINRLHEFVWLQRDVVGQLAHGDIFSRPPDILPTSAITNPAVSRASCVSPASRHGRR